MFIGSLLFAVNTIIGLLISNYSKFNYFSVDVVLIINTILIYRLSIDNISNGYKISLSIIYPLLCLLSVILALLSPEKLKDNYYTISLILMLFIEISLYLLATNLRHINSKK